MKRLFLLLTLSIALYGCSEKEEPSDTKTETEVKTNGTMKKTEKPKLSFGEEVDQKAEKLKIKDGNPPKLTLPED